MKAMFVNQLSHQGVKYADAIADGIKPVETRSRNMLQALVGERVAIVRTMRGKAPTVMGYVTVCSATFKPWEWMDANRDLTLIPSGSKYDCTGRGEWCYFLRDAERCDPFPLPPSAIRHGRSWCEF